MHFRVTYFLGILVDRIVRSRSCYWIIQIAAQNRYALGYYLPGRSKHYSNEKQHFKPPNRLLNALTVAI